MKEYEFEVSFRVKLKATNIMAAISVLKGWHKSFGKVTLCGVGLCGSTASPSHRFHAPSYWKYNRVSLKGPDVRLIDGDKG